MRSDCTQLGYIVCTLCTHCVRSPQRLATCAFAGALQTQQGRAQKVSPGANVFSWQFCTRTSRSRQLNRYGWRAMGLQRWVGPGGRGEGTNKVRDEKQPQRAGQEPCLCVPNIVHCGTQNRPWASAARAEVFFCYNSFSGLSINRFGRLFVDVTKDTRRFSVKSRSVKIHGSGEVSLAASAE